MLKTYQQILMLFLTAGQLHGNSFQAYEGSETWTVLCQQSANGVVHNQGAKV